MKKYFIVEILCVLLAVSYIVYSVSTTSVTTIKSAEEISSLLVTDMSTDDICERNINFITEKYGVSSSMFSSVVCFSSDDVMNVNELFIGVLTDESNDEIIRSFEDYAEDRFNLYNGYAPEQAALIDNYVLDVSSGALIFCIDDNAEAIYSKLLKIL